MSEPAQPPDAAAFATLLARLAELERINGDLLRKNQELKRENHELPAKVVALDAQLRRVVRRAFAPSSEVLIAEPGQARIPELVDAIAHLRQEAEHAGVVLPALIPDERHEQLSAQPQRRTAAGRGRGRLTLPDHLARVEERVEVQPHQRQDVDGSLLVPVGTERTSRLDWEPGRFIHHVTIRTRYGRRDTREPVLTAPVPPTIVPRGLGGDRLVLHIAHQKYALGIPLYRQHSDWLRQGVGLSTQTACSWMGHLARRLDGLTGAIRQQALAQPIIHLDDTPIKQLEHGRRRGSCRIARIWCYTAADQVFFDFTDSREGRWPGDLLHGYRGHIVADAYGGHDHLFTGHGGTATEVACWAHARRPFNERLDDAPGARPQLELIQALYRIDRVAAIVAETLHRDPITERTRLRQQEAPPLLAAIRTRTDVLIATEPDESPMAAGARYLRNHWDALTCFVTDGRLPLDNNAAERQQRPIAVGRKNWLFVDSEDGATWAATLLAVFQSCRLQRLDPLAYLTDIMPAVIAGDVDPLLLTPAVYAQQRNNKAA